MKSGYTALAFLVGLVVWIVTAVVLFSLLHVWLGNREAHLTEPTSHLVSAEWPISRDALRV